MIKFFRLALLMMTMTVPAFAQKPQLWQTMQQSLFDWNSVKFSFLQQYRFEMSDFKTVDARFGILAKKSLDETWDAEIHYMWINSRAPAETLFQHRHRLELELNPRFKICENIEFKFRNRYELIKEEREAKLIQKFRQRQEIAYKPGIKWLKSVALSNEIFYNITINKVDEYRLIPLDLAFPLQKDHRYKLYTMIRWRDSPTGWHPQFILGSTLDW
ncbi:DUF2490 domain-containing protein [Estrella lausannensis]|uniref:Putative membrane protein n=1 Tax=Estrella lausannensis TaxID=483423 RepID=A0A0H5DQD1_9BACT|nr:DUF2490 domain-containing protein [Estrella lausannensis]CRX38722.1 putative membrane protein [Estrella lausannensis]